MCMFEWSFVYEVGDPIIDAQHKRFVDLTNKVFEAMSSGKGATIVGPTLDALFAHTLEHFEEEQKFMDRYDYPEKEAHKAEHDRFTKRLAYCKEQAKTEDLKLATVRLAALLREWLIDHVLVEDKKLYGRTSILP
jgi:hemerythrin-like metal-binding protein